MSSSISQDLAFMLLAIIVPLAILSIIGFALEGGRKDTVSEPEGAERPRETTVKNAVPIETLSRATAYRRRNLRASSNSYPTRH